MDYNMIILRILHIGGGVVWAGAVFYMAFFLLPAAKSLGPESGKFMQRLAMTNHLPTVISVVSFLNILSGILILWYYTAGFTNDFMGSPTGIAYSIGGALTLIAYVMGLVINKPATAKIKRIGMEAAKRNQPPTPEQVQSMQKLQAGMRLSTHVIACLLAITVVLMSIARNL